MMKKTRLMIGLLTAWMLCTAPSYADRSNNFGQTLKIRTNLHTFVGKPAWLLIIRDIDHNQNIPYLYDFSQGTNYWLTFTFGRNYFITTSELTFNPYGRKIKNFCGLESRGAIQRSVDMDIHITGDLSPNTDTFECTVMKYHNTNFNIVNPA